MIRVIRPHPVASSGAETVGDREIQTMPWLLPSWRGEHVFFQVTPNPAAGGVAIQLNLPTESQVTVRILNAAGAVVRNLFDGRLNPGRHNIAWTGRGEGGGRVAPGVYFCVVKAGDVSAVQKILLMR
jgi:flagellar hook assembly protein FlgD